MDLFSSSFLALEEKERNKPLPSEVFKVRKKKGGGEEKKSYSFFPSASKAERGTHKSHGSTSMELVNL